MSSSSKNHLSSRPPKYPPPAPPAIDAHATLTSSFLENVTAFAPNLFENHAEDEEIGRPKSPSVPIPDRGHGIQLEENMMDPFEVRIRFTQHLQHLNASVTSANKAAQYALKYRDMDEDLHSCILEQLERVSSLLDFPSFHTSSRIVFTDQLEAG
jgi:hypothetical protein